MGKASDLRDVRYMILTTRDLKQLKSRKDRRDTKTSPYFKSLPQVRDEELATREKGQAIRKRERTSLRANVTEDTRRAYNKWIQQQLVEKDKWRNL